MENRNINYYINIFRKLQFEKNFDKSIRIALLSSCTIRGLKETLVVKCSEFKVKADIYECNYGQYAQDILDKQSKLYKFNPEIIILFIDLQSLMGDVFFIPNSISDKERLKFIDEKTNMIFNLVDLLKDGTKSKIILHNFEVPIYSPFGILDEKQEFGYIESIEELNKNLRSYYKIDSQVFVFNFNIFCSKYGKKNIQDSKMYYLADIKIKFDYIPHLCDEYVKYIMAIAARTKKCIVLDLDNTLWGGIIGESDIHNIKLGPTGIGKPFYEFQKYLLALNKRGIILAINSKNNFNDAIEIINNHQYMVLKEENFACIKINWNDKVQNLKEIAKEINIGLDSIVFIDDDKFHVNMLKDMLPEVKSICLPNDPALFTDTLKELNFFDTLQLTEEDFNKSKQYYNQRQRNELKTNIQSIDDYLAALEMKVIISVNNLNHIPRLVQLTYKTNQFNLTTRRYTEEEIKSFMIDNRHLVLSVEVIDKFGDNGISGLCIIVNENNVWCIDTLLLSCRIIGRKVENVIMKTIIEFAEKEHIKMLYGEYVKSKKNIMVENFYNKCGFYLFESSLGVSKWKYDFSKKIDSPIFIGVELNE